MADKKIDGSVEITESIKINGVLNPNDSGFGISLPGTSGLTGNKTIATLDDIQDISDSSNYVQVGDVDQNIDGRKTFVKYPDINGISRSAKTTSDASDGKVAGFIYSSQSGSSVTSEGHFTAYGADDTNDGSKPTAN